MNENDLQQKRINDGAIFYQQMIRNQRNDLLKNTDKYLLPDYPITPDQIPIIKTYRQALRDTPENNFILPTPPDFIK